MPIDAIKIPDYIYGKRLDDTQKQTLAGGGQAPINDIQRKNNTMLSGSLSWMPHRKEIGRASCRERGRYWKITGWSPLRTCAIRRPNSYSPMTSVSVTKAKPAHRQERPRAQTAAHRGGRRRKPSRKQRTMWPRSKRKPTRANSPSVNPQTVIHTIYRKYHEKHTNRFHKCVGTYSRYNCQTAGKERGDGEEPSRVTRDCFDHMA